MRYAQVGGVRTMATSGDHYFAVARLTEGHLYLYRRGRFQLLRLGSDQEQMPANNRNLLLSKRDGIPILGFPGVRN